MKKMKKVMLFVLTLAIGPCVMAETSQPTVKKVAAGMDIVYLKVTCFMIGGAIQIYNSSGELIHTETVMHHKLIVDFYAEPSDEYTIHFVKDNVDEEVHYSKRTASQAERASQNYVSITQR